MQSKFGKEKKLFTNEKFRVKYGTIDALKLNAIYINIDSWVEPGDIDNYESYIRSIRKRVILSIKSNLDTEVFSKNIIVDLDLRASGMTVGKKSFMSIEVTVYPSIKTSFNSDTILSNVKSISDDVIRSLETEDLTFYSKKKMGKNTKCTQQN